MEKNILCSADHDIIIISASQCGKADIPSGPGSLSDIVICNYAILRKHHRNPILCHTRNTIVTKPAQRVNAFNTASVRINVDIVIFIYPDGFLGCTDIQITLRITDDRSYRI